MRALKFLAHVGNHLREYDIHVHNRWVGAVALTADQMVLSVQVRIVRAKGTLAGEARKLRVERRAFLWLALEPAGPAQPMRGSCR